MLWELLATRPDWRLVTGDQRLLQAADMRGRVMAPAAFVTGADAAGGPD